MKILSLFSAIVAAFLALTSLENANAQGTWVTVTSILTPVARSASAVLNGELYVVGGEYSSGQYTDAVQVYNPVSNTWRVAHSLSHTSGEAAAASALGQLYVIGGLLGASSPSLKTVSIYDPLTDNWTTGSSMLIEKSNFVAAEVNGKIYALGGYRPDNNARIDDAEVYDPLQDQWMALPPLPGPRGNPAGAAVGDKIYVFGGDDATGTQTNTVFEFNTLNHKWTPKSPMPIARDSASAVVLNGLIYVMGGVTLVSVSPPASMVDSRVDVYDPVADTWSAGVALPEPLARLASGTIANSIYVTAGNFNSNKTYKSTAPAGPQSITDAISIIQSQPSLTGGQQNSLTSKLEGAQASIGSGNSNAACGQLGAFINEVNANRRSGRLDQSPATTLITFVATLRQSLGCPP